MAFSINSTVARVSEPPTNETRDWVAKRAFNPELPLIDAAQAVPNYPPADALIEHLAEELHAPDTAFYTPILGLASLREALAASLSDQYEADLGANNIAITCGGNHAYCMAIQALAGSGDDVILPEPFYFNHQMWFDLQGITTKLVACQRTDHGLVPDLDEIASMIGERSRAIVLVSPNNPTGTIYSPQYLSAAFELARSRGLALVVDETYKDFIADRTCPHTLFREPDWGDTFVFLYSFSKVFSLTGYRVGALAGGSRLLEAIAKIADTLTICAPHVSQKAALFGLRSLDAWTAAKRDDLNRRLTLLRQAFARNQSTFELVSSGAFFAYLGHSFEGISSLEASRRVLREQSILTWPGSFFGPNQERYVRLAFANAGDGEIEELARRLAQMTL